MSTFFVVTLYQYQWYKDIIIRNKKPTDQYFSKMYTMELMLTITEFDVKLEKRSFVVHSAVVEITRYKLSIIY